MLTLGMSLTWQNSQVNIYFSFLFFSFSIILFLFLFLSFSHIGMHEIIARVRISIVYK